MSFAYIGTDQFAAEVLRRLVSGGQRPTLVVSRPDSKQGRGRQLSPPPVAVAAAELGIDLVQPESANGEELTAELEQRAPDVLCLCAYGAIIREPLLSKWTILNLHPSLLPRWRGAAPIERSLMAGDKVTGVSIIRLVEELDAGPVAAMQEVEISSSDDFASLSSRLQQVGATMLAEAIELDAVGGLEFVNQSDAGLTYAERILAPDRLLDPSRPASELECAVRALRPHIGARLELGTGEIIGIREAHVIGPGPAEGVVEARDGSLVLGCAQGALQITRLVPPGGRELAAADWLRGRPQLG